MTDPIPNSEGLQNVGERSLLTMRKLQELIFTTADSRKILWIILLMTFIFVLCLYWCQGTL